MRQLSKLTVLVLAATALATSPASEVASIAPELVSTIEVQAATKTITPKHSAKSYPIITKTGTYDVKLNDLNDKVFAFKAPKAGTYVFKFKNLRGKGETVEDSFCELGFDVGKGAPYNLQGAIGIGDGDKPVYVTNYLNQWGEKSRGGSIGLSSVRRVIRWVLLGCREHGRVLRNAWSVPADSNSESETEEG